jgi:hypothetical protein
VGITLVAALLGSGCAKSAAEAAADRAWGLSPPSEVEAPSTTVPTTTMPARSTADPDGAAAAAATRAGDVEWALVDLATGESFGSGTLTDPQLAIDGASIGKVLIAVAALERRLAVGSANTLITSMIEQSDNEAASELYDAVGGKPTIEDLMRRTGMTSSSAGRNWGAMAITASDMASFLAQLAGGGLLGADTHVVVDAMRAVIGSQRWGIADGAVDEPAAAVKNGWYPDADGRWRLHCTALVGDVNAHDADRGAAVVVMTHYPLELGMAYGEETCRIVASALLPHLLLGGLAG